MVVLGCVCRTRGDEGSLAALLMSSPPLLGWRLLFEFGTVCTDGCRPLYLGVVSAEEPAVWSSGRCSACAAPHAAKTLLRVSGEHPNLFIISALSDVLQSGVKTQTWLTILCLISFFLLVPGTCVVLYTLLGRRTVLRRISRLVPSCTSCDVCLSCNNLVSANCPLKQCVAQLLLE